MSYEDAPRAAWVRELIGDVRAGAASIPSTASGHVGLVALAFEPCQVLAFFLSWRKSLRLYALHLSGVPDLTVWAYSLPSEGDLVRLLERIEKDPPFQEEVPVGEPYRPQPPSPPTYSALLQLRWEEWLEELRGSAYHQPSESGTGFTWGGVAIQKFDFYGEEGERSPAETIRRQVEWASEWTSRFGLSAPPSPTPRTRAEIDGAIARQQAAFDATTDWLGTYSTPPIRVGFSPERTLEERMRHRTTPDVAEFGKVVVTEQTHGSEVLCTDFGFIGIHNLDRGVVTGLLNLLFGALYLSGFRCHRVLPTDLCQFQYDLARSSFGNSSVPPSDRILHNKLPRYHRLYQSPQFVPLEAMRDAIHDMELMNADSRLPALVPLILDSRLMLDSKDWDHSFFSAWLAIERHTIAEVDDGIQLGVVTSSTLTALKSSGGPLFSSLETDPTRLRESVAYSINALLGLGTLSRNDWADFDGLRKMRRRILHPSSKATEVEAKGCLSIASRVVERRASNLLGRVVTTPAL